MEAESLVLEIWEFGEWVFPSVSWTLGSWNFRQGETTKMGG